MPIQAALLMLQGILAEEDWSWRRRALINVEGQTCRLAAC
jgi:hypothetical protein